MGFSATGDSARVNNLLAQTFPVSSISTLRPKAVLGQDQLISNQGGKWHLGDDGTASRGQWAPLSGGSPFKLLLTPSVVECPPPCHPHVPTDISVYPSQAPAP